MTIKKVKATALPAIKPWCFRVTRTGAKKYGARENWPLEQRQKRAGARRAKRNTRGDPTEYELLLRAEAKTGGIEAQIARMKLRALKAYKRVDAEQMRRQICERLEKLHDTRSQMATRVDVKKR